MENLLRLQALFEKFLQRKCTPQEVEEMIALMRDAQAGDALEKPMEELWIQAKDGTTDPSVDWDKMYTSVISTEDGWDRSLRIARRSVYRWRYSAAAVLLLAFAAVLYWWLGSKGLANRKPELAKTTPGTELPITVTRQTIHLPDGSTVILNANSKLNYPPAFNNNREVYLTGEGYFDIVHKADQPFLVHTGKLTIKVLGTAFDIKAYSADDLVHITVTRGKVQVLNNNKTLGLLTSNQQISFSNKTGQFTQQQADTQQVMAWKPTEIFFNDITMEEAAREIEKRFNTEVFFKNPAVKLCRVTATFSEDDMADEILAVICMVSKASYSIQNNKIIIDGKGCNEPGRALVK